MNSYFINEWISVIIIVIFLIIYLIRFYLVMSGDDWFIMWLGLEINIMIFILFIFERNRIVRVESCLKYFFIQSVGSAVLIRIFYLNKEWLDFCLCLLLRYKIGAGPFFFWFPSVCGGISWMSCFLLISFQKVIPLILMVIFVSWIIYWIVVLRLIFGVLGSFNQINLKQLIAYSSVYHLGWIILCNISGEINWMEYLLIYSVIIFPVLVCLKYFNINDIGMIIKMKYKNWFIFLILRMAGIPPFLGFFLKWYAFIIIFKFEYIFFIFLIVCSVVIFYIYFRVVYDVLVMNYYNRLWCNVFMKRSALYLDMFGIFGLVVGLFLGVIMIF